MKVKTNLLIDLGIFVALLVALEPSLTGIPIHEWFSAAFAGAIIVHLLLHWDWMVNVMFKFFKKLFHTSRLQFAVDTLLFVTMTAVIASGLLISKTVMPALGLSVIRNPMMQGLHSLSANATLLLVGVHFALNWNWVVSAVRRVIVLPLLSVFGKKQPVTVDANRQ